MADDFLKLWEKKGGTVKTLDQKTKYKNNRKNERDITERLEELKDLKDRGLITEEDYNKKKKEILDEF